MADDDCICPKPAGGAPAWVVTFADLMSLLLTFFILLLSFSTMEVAKFKKIAGSLRDAFGVQRAILEDSYPKGTSAFLDHYSPGKPDVLTMDNSQPVNLKDPVIEKIKSEQEKAEKKEFEENVEKVKAVLKEDIVKGNVEVAVKGKNIIIRVPEQVSFSSGSADFNKGFGETLVKIGKMVKEINGTINVTGHTDDRPIRTQKYRSNWDLSSARAVTMAHALMKITDTDQSRFTVSGHADTVPVAPNDSAEGRSKNRRVEVVIGTSKTVSEVAQ